MDDPWELFQNKRRRYGPYSNRHQRRLHVTQVLHLQRLQQIQTAAAIPASLQEQAAVRCAEQITSENESSSEEELLQNGEYSNDMEHTEASSVRIGASEASEISDISSVPDEPHNASENGRYEDEHDGANSNVRADIAEHQTFKARIADWIVRRNIKQNAADEILAIFREEPWGKDFPKSTRSLLQTPRDVNIKNISNGSYYHIGLEGNIRKVLEQISVTEREEVIKLKIGIDGLNISRSSGSCFWPILGCLCNASRSNMFIIGVFHGSSKPSNPVLEDFVNELITLTENGLVIDGRVHKMEIVCFLCDSPARSFVTCTKSHNGYFACPFCMIEGDFLDGKVVYVDRQNHRRTDEDFRRKINEEHHVGSSVLQNVPRLDMILCFPVEPMHLLYLGVTRRMIMYWLNGPKKKLRLRKIKYDLLCQFLGNISKDIPSDFARQPRSLEFVKRWKATEFRQFLLNSGPVVLKNCVSNRVWCNFLVLHVAARLLSSQEFYLSRNRQSHELLNFFLDECIALYGPGMMTLNVHCLRHLAECAEQFGPLEEFSASHLKVSWARLNACCEVATNLCHRSLSVSER